MFETVMKWMGKSPKVPEPAPLSEQEEMQLLFSRIGGALVACQLVETNLHAMLKNVLGDEELKAAGSNAEKRPMLNKMIRRLEQRGDVPKDFTSVLDKFREKRNAFVHRLLDGEGASVLTHEGRMTCYLTAAEVHSLASGLMKVFGDVFADYYTDLGFYWPHPRAFGPKSPT
jgi:hypothetical protein